MSECLRLIDKVFRTSDLSDEELFFLLQNINSAERMQLYTVARDKKKEVYGKGIFLRGLLEFSNHCRRNCQYCGIFKFNTKLERYRLCQEDMLQACQVGFFLGYRTFVFQAGEDPCYKLGDYCEMASMIKAQFPQVALTLSAGEFALDAYPVLFKAGWDRYLMRFETADEELYQRFHPGYTLGKRLEHLEALFAAGFQTGSGFLVGLPGETRQTLVKNLRLAKSYGFHMVGVGPFIPHEATPLWQQGGGDLQTVLDMTALVRLLLPETLIPATTALGSLDPIGREKGLRAGANVMMPNISPPEVRPKYELYPDKICVKDKAEHCRFCIQGRIRNAGFEIDMGRGDHINFRKELEEA